MELKTKEIWTKELVKSILDQFVLDEDYNVPDSKRDMKRIIASEAKVRIEEVKPVENYVRVSGKLEFQVLYVGEGLEATISSLEGKIPFEEMVYVESANGEYKVQAGRVDLQASMIHSRKLRLKSFVELELEVYREVQEEIPLDVDARETIFQKKMELGMLVLHTQKQDTYRVKEELSLPGTRENIGTLLWTDISNRKLDTKLEEDEFVLSGEFLVFCFYESPDGKLDWIEQTVPYQGRIPCRNVDASMYHQVKAELEDAHADVRMDEDGEMRLIGIEGTLKMEISIYQEEHMEVLEDVYSLEKQCRSERKEIPCERLVLQNHSKCKVTQKLSLPELKNSVLQICHSSGSIQVDHTTQEEQGVLVEGALHVSFLFVKANDEVPFDCWSGVVPFSYLIECGGLSEHLQFQISALLEQLSVTLLGGDEVEVKAVLAFHSFFRDVRKMKMITDIQLEKLNMEEMEKRPGVIGYIVKEGDDLWKLAKRYFSTKEGIMQVNEMTSEELKVGERILIFRENLSIL